MRIPSSLADAFGANFEKLITSFAQQEGLLPDDASLQSVRFLRRSVLPHVERLSALFNREEKEQDSALPPYWKEGSNPAHLRLAYFLYFMPCNLFRVSSVWSELARLGFRWNAGPVSGIEFGAGPASGVCGVAAGEAHASVGLPPGGGTWALIEQDRQILELGSRWAQMYFGASGFGDHTFRTFHRKIDPLKGFLPRSAPKFNLWLMSYFLNESTLSMRDLAKSLLAAWKHHLEEEGIIILVEPALKLQSRRLLELRQEILRERDRTGADWLQILLPCLGHQTCGAFTAPEDWCHEDVLWWRPPYFKIMDRLAGLDRRSLPFSYLVLCKSSRAREKILPALNAKTDENQRYRLVSPSHREGRDQEFFLCGQDGKRRARYRATGEEDPCSELQRGDILIDSEVRGSKQASRVEKVKKRV